MRLERLRGNTEHDIRVADRRSEHILNGEVDGRDIPSDDCHRPRPEQGRNFERNAGIGQTSDGHLDVGAGCRRQPDRKFMRTSVKTPRRTKPVHMGREVARREHRFTVEGDMRGGDAGSAQVDVIPVRQQDAVQALERGGERDAIPAGRAVVARESRRLKGTNCTVVGTWVTGCGQRRGVGCRIRRVVWRLRRKARGNRKSCREAEPTAPRCAKCGPVGGYCTGTCPRARPPARPETRHGAPSFPDRSRRLRSLAPSASAVNLRCLPLLDKRGSG